MGAVKKALKPVTQFVDRIVPNEIKPALPFVAATFGAPYLSGFLGKGLGALGMKALPAAVTKGLAGGIANLGTQALLGQKISPMSALFSAGTIGGGEYLKGLDSKFAKGLGSLVSPDKISAMSPGEALQAAYTPVGAGAAKSAYDAGVEAERAYEEYLASQEAAGAEDTQSRVDFITSYMSRAGYDQDRINETLNNMGYAANGGLMGTRVGFEIGGMSDLGKLFSKVTGKKPTEESLMDLKSRYAKEIENQMISELGEDYPSVDVLNQIRNEANKQADIALSNYMESLGMEPFNPPEGTIGADVIEQVMEPRKEGRVMEADGGMINMKMGGMPAEMDLRGGGFVPLGAKERADDVPARLSKNEFVMTADAVRAAGGGSVNKGAKRMYNLMNNLEARV
jgi:hypothetical protein